MFFACSKPPEYDEETHRPSTSVFTNTPLKVDDRPYVAVNTKLNQEECQAKFMEIVKYYNDVIMTNALVFSETAVLKAQKMIHDIECERGQLYNPIPRSMNPLDTRSDFFRYVLKKVEDLQNVLEYQHKQLSYFYTRYKREYHNVSILVIILSSAMSLVEGITLVFNPHNKATPVVMLGMSSTIAITTSVLKFRNTKEKIEGIIKMKEKIQMCQAKLFTFDKELKTSLFLSPSSTSNVHTE